MAWSVAPEELLAGPRGRRLCLELVSPWREDTAVQPSPGWHGLASGLGGASPRQLAAELAALVSAADLTAVTTGPGETGLLAPVHSSVDAARYWQPPDGLDLALAEPAVAAALGPVARVLTAFPATAWWASPLARDGQQFVEVLDRDLARADNGPVLSGTAERLASWLASTLEDERGAAARPPDPAAPYSGYWWSSPAAAGLATTSRSLPGLAAVGLELVEDHPGWRDVACWPLAPAAEVRVYEISGPQDWAALAARYPLDVSKSRKHDWWRVTGLAGAWIIPDYVAVAADYEAVHLTVTGYLTSAGRALPLDEKLTAGGTVARTMLAGWNPDETYWLADVLTTAGPPVRWVNPDREPLAWECAG